MSQWFWTRHINRMLSKAKRKGWNVDEDENWVRIWTREDRFILISREVLH